MRGRVPHQARVRIANGPAAGWLVTVALDAQGYPPTDAVVAIIAGRAVARSNAKASEGAGDGRAWTAYTAQQVGHGRWEYVAERFSRV